MSWFSSSSSSRRQQNERDENLTGYSTSATSTAQLTSPPTILVAWNTTAVATIVLPLMLFAIANLFARRGEGGGGEGERWWNWDGPEEERFSGLGRTFVYLWSLVIFALIVWRGNRVLQSGRDIRVLFVALAVFANLVFLCWILLATGGPREGAAEDEAWIGQFSSVMLLTFFLWLVFSAAFAGILYPKARREGAASSSSSSYSLWGTGDGHNNNNHYKGFF